MRGGRRRGMRGASPRGSFPAASRLQRTVQGLQRTVEVRPAVAEHAPGAAGALQRIEVEGVDKDTFLGAVQLLDFLAERVGDERRTIEGDVVAILLLAADAIGSHQRHQVGSGMALLHALPVIARADAGVVRFATDGGRVEQEFRAEQGHAARRFGEPLVPADTDADPCVAGLPDLEAGVARIEVVLLVVARAVRDVALAVDPEVAAIGVDDRDAVEAGAPGAFEEADRQYHLQLPGEGLEVGDGGVLLDRGGQLQVVRVRLLAEVGGLEQFLDQDDLRTPGGGLAHQFLGAGDVRRTIPGAGHLGGGDGDVAGHGAPRVLARMAAGLGGGRLWVGRAGTGCRARSSDGRIYIR